MRLHYEHVMAVPRLGVRLHYEHVMAVPRPGCEATL